VENPAIQENFLYFNEQKEKMNFAKIDNEERKLVGPILIPDLRIMRVDEQDNSTYEVFFSKKTVAQLAQNYLKKKYVDKATLEHDKKLKGLTLVESWIKESKVNDKSNLYGLSNIPVGSWMGIFQVDRTPEGDKLWNDYVKTGKVKGFSVEALLSHKLIKASEQVTNKDIKELDEEEANIVLAHIKHIIKKDKRFTKGQTLLAESHSDYGDGIKNNAKRGRELNEKNGNKCATQVGKVRSAQLEKGEPISLETIKRMYSYLSRAEAYYDESDMNACGTISYLMWGGKAALSWSRNKLKELGQLELEGQPSIPASSYPGESGTKKKKNYIHPALIGTKD